MQNINLMTHGKKYPLDRETTKQCLYLEPKLKSEQVLGQAKEELDYDSCKFKPLGTHPKTEVSLQIYPNLCFKINELNLQKDALFGIDQLDPDHYESLTKKDFNNLPSIAHDQSPTSKYHVKDDELLARTRGRFGAPLLLDYANAGDLVSGNVPKALVTTSHLQDRVSNEWQLARIIEPIRSQLRNARWHGVCKLYHLCADVNDPIDEKGMRSALDLAQCPMDEELRAQILLLVTKAPNEVDWKTFCAVCDWKGDLLDGATQRKLRINASKSEEDCQVLTETARTGIRREMLSYKTENCQYGLHNHVMKSPSSPVSTTNISKAYMNVAQGDQPMQRRVDTAYSLVNPSNFSNNGISIQDLARRHSRSELKRILANTKYESLFSEENNSQLDHLWTKALSIDPNSHGQSVSFRSFNQALLEHENEKIRKMVECQYF
ncbi:hypothetical protein Ciccas_006502 [Cichlidogyrus casuarinus]|uniref:EFHB C-terminal EF-hand domain-containing protein n=1 Tax=Cichlidogyrus casuarinus TaxID=1844966 RepID=A0ABD2Q5L1_9PLAT